VYLVQFLTVVFIFFAVFRQFLIRKNIIFSVVRNVTTRNTNFHFLVRVNLFRKQKKKNFCWLCSLTHQIFRMSILSNNLRIGFLFKKIYMYSGICITRYATWACPRKCMLYEKNYLIYTVIFGLLKFFTQAIDGMFSFLYSDFWWLIEFLYPSTPSWINPPFEKKYYVHNGPTFLKTFLN
jgi:hypothetical protein